MGKRTVLAGDQLSVKGWESSDIVLDGLAECASTYHLYTKGVFCEEYWRPGKLPKGVRRRRTSMAKRANVKRAVFGTLPTELAAHKSALVAWSICRRGKF